MTPWPSWVSSVCEALCHLQGLMHLYAFQCPSVVLIIMADSGWQMEKKRLGDAQGFTGRPSTQCWPHSSASQGSGGTPVTNFPSGFHNVHKSLILILCSGYAFQLPKSVNVFLSLCMQSKNLLSIFAHWFWRVSPCVGCTWLIYTRPWLDPYPAHLTGQSQGPMSVRKL